MKFAYSSGVESAELYRRYRESLEDLQKRHANMGVPKFFRFIAERYPALLQAVGTGETSGLKPAIDCLYLDMNGIVHNCTHANGSVDSIPTEDEMFKAIMEYIDKIITIAAPRKLVYMAIDGVAPRAKMNQQRQRRFRSARDAAEAAANALAEGRILPEDPFDSNCITPGTAFMERLSAHVQYFVRRKFADDKSWQGLKVYFSGAEVVGEGEHKIMSFIRSARMQPDYDPTLSHCLYGLDADLIMLTLVSHEHNALLLREEVVFGPPKEGVHRQTLNNPNAMQLFHISLLREYLALEFANPALPFPFDVDRVVDDWIFMLFLIGNDFLPSIPTLEIADGGIAAIYNVYKALLPRLGGYLTHWGTLNVSRFIPLLAALAQTESAIFEKRADDAAREADRAHRFGNRGGFARPAWAEPRPTGGNPKVARLPLGKASSLLEGKGKGEEEEEQVIFTSAGKGKGGSATAALLAAEGGDDDVENNEEEEEVPVVSVLPPDAHRADIPSSDDEAADEESSALARLAAMGIDVDRFEGDSATAEMYLAEMESGDTNAANYYRRKFPEFYHGTPENAALPEELRGLTLQQHIDRLCASFYEGLLWCHKYYYSGVQSWRWHYPYRYAPLLSSLVAANLQNVRLDFAIGTPFRPLEQLMGVLPPLSAKLLPPAWRSLMTSKDSEVKDFYPDSFEVDMEGCRNPWEGVTLIPFIEEGRLLNALHAIPEGDLTKQERNRNRNVEADWLFTYDVNNLETYHLASAFNTFADSAAASAGSTDAAAEVGYLANTSLFPSIRNCRSRAVPFRFPPIPAEPHFVTDEMRKTLAYLNELDATVLNLYYGDVVPAAAAARGARSVGEGRYLPVKLPGALIPAPGFPSLMFMPGAVGAATAPNTVDLFGRPSRNPSLAVRCSPEHIVAFSDGSHAARAFPVGCRVFVDYPHLREALVVRVQDGNSTWDMPPTSGGSVYGRPSTHRERADYQQAVRDITARHHKRLALEAGAARVIVFARPLLGMQRAPDGSVRKHFAPDTITGTVTGYESDYKEIPGGGGNNRRGPRGGPATPGVTFNDNPERTMAFAAQTVFAAHPAGRPDTRWSEAPPPSPEELFPVGTRVVHAGAGHYGLPGVVTGLGKNEQGAVTLTLTLQKRPHVPPEIFRNFIAKGELRYFPSYLVARRLGIHGAVLARLCSSLVVEPGPTDIGFNIAFSQYGLCVPDYARRVAAWQAAKDSEAEAGARARAARAAGGDTAGASDEFVTQEELEEHGAIRGSERGAGEQWEYSELTVRVLEQFTAQFPELISYLNANPHKPRVNAVHFAPSDIGADGYMKNVVRFIKSTAISSLVAVSTSAISAPARSCLLVEQRAREYVVRLHDTLTGESHSPPSTFDFTKETLVAGKPDTVTAFPAEVIAADSDPAWSPTAPRSQATSATAQFIALGDRVVSLRSDAGVPLGRYGTVVGILGSFVEVVFDLPFVTGTRLNGRCVDARGKFVPAASVLNVSDPRPVFVNAKGERTDVPATKAAPAAAKAKAPKAPKQQTSSPVEKDTKPAKPQQQQQQQSRKQQQNEGGAPQEGRRSAAPAGSTGAARSYTTTTTPAKGGKRSQQQVQVQVQTRQPAPQAAAATAAPVASGAIDLADLGLPSASATAAAAAAAASSADPAASQRQTLEDVRAAIASASARPAIPAAGPAAAAGGADGRVLPLGAGMGSYGQYYDPAAAMSGLHLGGGAGAGIGMGAVGAGALYSSHATPAQQQQQQQQQAQMMYHNPGYAPYGPGAAGMYGPGMGYGYGQYGQYPPHGGSPAGNYYPQQQQQPPRK